MSEKIRKPRKPKPPAAPEVPPPAPAGMPTGVPKGNVPRGNIAGGGPWALITKWRPVTWREGARHGVPWSMLEAMMVVESGGRVDAADPHGAVGLMQVKPQYWSAEAARLGYDLATPEGQIGTAAAILGGDVATTKGMTPEEAFLTVYYPTPGLDVPGESGHTPRQYLEDIALYRGILERAAGTTPAPAPEPTTPAPKPATVKDALLAVTGGRDARVHFPFGAMNTEPFYEYGIGRIRPLSVAKNSAYQHPGDDVDLPLGAPIFAPVAGTVVCAGTGVGQGAFSPPQSCAAFAADGGVGRVEVQVNATESLIFGHCHKALVKVGQKVEAGQQVATVGSFVGPHLHLEYRRWDAAKRDYTMHAPLPEIARLMGGATAGTTPAPRPAPVVYDLADPADAARFGLSPKQAAAIRAKRIPGRAGHRPQAIVWHVQDGNTRGSLTHWLTVNASANVMIQRDGSILRVIDDEDGPWTNGDVKNPDAWGRALAALGGGDPNNVSLTIEYEGEAGQGLTPAQEAAGLWQTEQWMDRYGIPIENVGGHYQINSVDRAHCPGPAVMAAKAKLRGGSGTTPAPAKRFPVAIPDAAVLTLFPFADPAGVVTKLWMANGCPVFVRESTDKDDGWRYWCFAGLTLRSKDGTVEAVTP